MTMMPIVGAEYCAAYPTEYVVQKKVLSFSGGDFTVTDTNGNLYFRVDGRTWSVRGKRVLLDARGRPVVSMKKKLLTMHNTWWTYLGESMADGNEVYTIKRSSIIQFRTSLDVLLARSNNHGQPDFTIKGNFLERSCQVCYHNQVAAEVKRRFSVSKVLLGKDTFSVFVYPGYDSAFIISLIVLMETIHEEEEHASQAS